MNLNADFEQRVAVHSAKLEWLDSPMPGVRRRMLDRMGDEVARATTIVSYAPGSHFSAHVHTGGEEFLVLEGVFQDEHGDFPVGAYVRNPPQSKHTPGSEQGCIIFVKLWQFEQDDRTQIITHINALEKFADTNRPGVRISPLFEDAQEKVRIEQWQAGASIELDTRGGVEMLVIEGSFKESSELFETHSWLRIPVGGRFLAQAGTAGARVWIKTGHLRFVSPPNQK